MKLGPDRMEMATRITGPLGPNRQRHSVKIGDGGQGGFAGGWVWDMGNKTRIKTSDGREITISRGEKVEIDGTTVENTNREEMGH